MTVTEIACIVFHSIALILVRTEIICNTEKLNVGLNPIIFSQVFAKENPQAKQGVEKVRQPPFLSCCHVLWSNTCIHGNHKALSAALSADHQGDGTETAA